MDYNKVESALAVELERSQSDRSLSVFIQTKNPLVGEQVAQLRSFGVASVQGDRLVTASVSPQAVAKLSDLLWVEQISLAKKRRPL
jgi:hypothetical protein